MKKYAKGLTLGAIAFAMAAGIHFQADAAVAAPNISLKEQTGSSQIVDVPVCGFTAGADAVL